MLRILFLYLIFPCLAYTQNQGNVWYFGNHAGLDFNTTPPTVLYNGQTEYYGCPACQAEGSAAISDSNGNLLFYTNGFKVWNKNHQVMPNGDSLYSSATSTQSSLIIPLPGSSRYFYVFTTDFFQNQLQRGFCYSIVDMCLENGMGDIVKGKKNQLLLGPVAEKLTAVKHSNGVDYWIIVHKYYSDAFYAFLFTANGVGAPVISNIGSVHPRGIQAAGAAIGQMKASPDGQRLAVVNTNDSLPVAEYFNFDKSTGTVSNFVNLQWNNLNGFYGTSFSPDNSKLYLAGVINGNGLYQFNLNAGNGNADSVRGSRVLIADTFNYFGMQLGPDGKIYVAHAPAVNNNFLDVIDNPNGLGAACNYIKMGVILGGGSAGYSPPNFVDSYDYDNMITECTSTAIGDMGNENIISLFPNPANQTLNIKLNTGTGSIKLYDATGGLLSRHTVSNHTAIDIAHLQSGMYFYELTVNGFIQQTKRGILIKE